MKLRATLVIITFLLLSAHFLRDDQIFYTIIFLLLPFLLLVKKRSSIIIVQIFSFIGVIVWLQTALKLIQERIMMDVSWTRMMIILSVVIILTGLSGFLLNSTVIKEKYRQ